VHRNSRLIESRVMRHGSTQTHVIWQSSTTCHQQLLTADYSTSPNYTPQHNRTGCLSCALFSHDTL